MIGAPPSRVHELTPRERARLAAELAHARRHWPTLAASASYRAGIADRIIRGRS